MYYTDQLGRTIELTSSPRRIISLVPSQTELLFDLGLNEGVAGITKFCVHPKEWHQSKARVGGTKNVNIKKVISLNPDLIIANKEENLKSDIEALEKFAPVWISDINDLDDAIDMIVAIGEVTSTTAKAKHLVTEINTGFKNISAFQAYQTCVYLIWHNPYMTAGADTFINNMFKYCGLENGFANKTRYPEISIAEMQAANPKVILLSSEPYPFKQKHINELQHFLPAAKIVLVDGEMFSWYGSRLIKAAKYFNETILNII
jgi:ABC-type Fe3+-hydroxamate transport system substrate-binding protein